MVSSGRQGCTGLVTRSRAIFAVSRWMSGNRRTTSTRCRSGSHWGKLGRQDMVPVAVRGVCLPFTGASMPVGQQVSIRHRHDEHRRGCTVARVGKCSAPESLEVGGTKPTGDVNSSMTRTALASPTMWCCSCEVSGDPISGSDPKNPPHTPPHTMALPRVHCVAYRWLMDYYRVI